MGARVIKKSKFSLNMFDAFVLLVAMAVGGFLLWRMLAPDQTTAAKTGVIEYTISIKEVQEGTGALVVAGSEIYDVVKNYHLGTVLSAQVTPAEKQVLNHGTKAYETSFLPGYEDIEVRLTTTMTESDTDILADAGFEMRVGTLLYMRGAGYMAVGYITQIDRTDGAEIPTHPRGEGLGTGVTSSEPMEEEGAFEDLDENSEGFEYSEGSDSLEELGESTEENQESEDLEEDAS